MKRDIKREFFELLSKQPELKEFRHIKSKDQLLFRDNKIDKLLWIRFVKGKFSHMSIGPIVRLTLPINEEDSITLQKFPPVEYRSYSKYNLFDSSLPHPTDDMLKAEAFSYHEYIHSHQRIEEVVKTVIEIYQLVAVPFYEKYSNIKNLKPLLKEADIKSLEELIPNIYEDGWKFLLIAKDHFPNLFDKVKRALQERGDKYHKQLKENFIEKINAINL